MTSIFLVGKLKIVGDTLASAFSLHPAVHECNYVDNMGGRVGKLHKAKVPIIIYPEERPIQRISDDPRMRPDHVDIVEALCKFKYGPMAGLEDDLVFQQPREWIRGKEAMNNPMIGEELYNNQERRGLFFGRRGRSVGQWQMGTGNVLSLQWQTPGRDLDMGMERRWDRLRASANEFDFENVAAGLKIQMLLPADTFAPGEKPLAPGWIAPRCLSEKFQTGSVTALCDCAFCHFPLWKFQSAVMRYQRARVCSHMLHAHCARHLLRCSTKQNRCTCPVCGSEFSESMPMPDIAKDPRGWFYAVDFAQRKRLTQV